MPRTPPRRVRTLRLLTPHSKKTSPESASSRGHPWIYNEDIANVNLLTGIEVLAWNSTETIIQRVFQHGLLYHLVDVRIFLIVRLGGGEESEAPGFRNFSASQSVQKVQFCALLGAVSGIGGNPTFCAD